MNPTKRPAPKNIVVSTRVNETQFIALRKVARNECSRASVSAAVRKLIREGLTRRTLAAMKGTQK